MTTTPPPTGPERGPAPTSREQTLEELFAPDPFGGTAGPTGSAGPEEGPP